MVKLESITPLFLKDDQYMLKDLEEGILYISERWKVAIHKCACGCGVKTVTPLGDGEWTLIKNDDKVSLTPSIGNFSGENPYHAHYFITENKINWC